jgi:hypothetical protein
MSCMVVVCVCEVYDQRRGEGGREGRGGMVVRPLSRIMVHACDDQNTHTHRKKRKKKEGNTYGHLERGLHLVHGDDAEVASGGAQAGAALAGHGGVPVRTVSHVLQTVGVAVPAR